MTIDCVTFNGEYELFDLRYNILKDVVDEFIVIEFDKTFSGKPKEMTFLENAYKYEKVTYHVVAEDQYAKYYELAQSSPNTHYGQGAEHWVREFAQKESIKDYLTHLNDDDVVFIGDADEIWHPDVLNSYLVRHITRFRWVPRLRLQVYTYFLNNRSDEKFHGIVVGTWGFLKGKVLNSLRSDPDTKAAPVSNTRKYDGWHFTSMGGSESLRKKLTDSYTAESYATKEILDNLGDNVDNSRDFLGRDFTYMVDESQWPTYLTENREKYAHLLK